MDQTMAFNPSLAQLTQRFQETNLGGGPAEASGLLGKPSDLLSSAEATTQYSPSESSSGADHLNSHLDSSSNLDTYPSSMAGRHGQSDVARQGNSISQEGKAQICFDFTKGVCSRGDKCKYSHDLATIVHFNSKEKGICFDYLRNQCHRGLLCRFSHDLSNIAQQCQVYNNGSKENKGAKPNAICYDFVKGVCQRGAECRYSHDLSLIARMARGGSAQPKAGEVCYDYLRGRCNRGATCKYSHNISFLAAPGFLGSALNSDGAPMAAQAPGAGLSGPNAPLAGIQLAAAPGFMGMGPMAGMNPRLAPTLSADQATLNHMLAAAAPGSMNQMLAAQAAMQQSHSLAAAAEAAAVVAEGRRRSGSFTGELTNDTLLVNDQPSSNWQGVGGAQAKAFAAAQQAALMSNLAAQQRMARAAANMHAFGPMAQMPGLGVQGVPGAVSDTVGADSFTGPGVQGIQPSAFAKAPGIGQFSAVPDAGVRNMGRPPLPPGAMPELASFLSGGLADNPNLFAETLAAAAKAQAQSQNARMMAGASGGSGPMMQPSGGMGSVGAPQPAAAAMPQPIPGRESLMPQSSYDAGSNGSYTVAGGPFASGPPPAVEQLSRSAPAVPAPDALLPMIKEIWSKREGM